MRPSSVVAWTPVGVLFASMWWGACRRSPDSAPARDAGPTAASGPGTLCVEQPDGCLLCDDGRDTETTFLDPEEPRPILCDPRDDEDCVEFCSRVQAPCAVPWAKGNTCKLGSELEYRRAIFLRDAAGSAEANVQGKVVDDAGRRIEGARIRVWVAGPGATTPIFDEVSGRDGSFRLKLPIGAWTYSLRVSAPGKATELIERLPLDRSGPERNERADRPPAPPRLYRLGDELVFKGRVVDGSSGEPISDVNVEAVRGPDDAVPLGEARSGADGSFTLGGLEGRRYHLRVTKFGWRPLAAKATPAAAAPRVALKLGRASVIRGLVLDEDGAPETNATVAALQSGAAGAPNLPILWSTDGEGAFAQDRFVPGPYYVWARRGEMLSYPPEKVELSENRESELKLVLSHKGARVTGRVRPYAGTVLGEGRARVLMVSRSPLAFPRPAVGEVRAGGAFTLAGLLPGRYEIVIRDGLRTLAIIDGPRTVEVPIEPDSAVALEGTIVVRGGLED